MRVTARLSRDLDHWKGVPEAGVWQPTEVIKVGEANFWLPGDNVLIPYGHVPAFDAVRLVGFLYSHRQIEDFLLNQINDDMTTKVEEMRQWLTCPR